MVKRIAHFMMLKLPNSVQVDDMIQAGMIGLLDAAGRYDELRGAQFETYASQRIRGAMLDELREADWLPRSMRSDMRRIESADLPRPAAPGKSPGRLRHRQRNGPAACRNTSSCCRNRMARNCCITRISTTPTEEDFFERFETDGKSNPLELLKDERFRERLVKAIGACRNANAC